jgi:hydroxypyruvate isomerase
MPKFAANLTMLYNEVDFIDRFDAAAGDGFKGVEYLFPYAYPKEKLAEALQRNGLTQVLHNLPAGDWAAGERGIACLPDRVGEFQDGVGRTIEYAQALGCKQVNCLVGLPPDGVAADKVRATVVGNLKFAAGKLKEAGIRLLTEPINTRDIPRFYLCHTQQAIDIMDEVGSDNLWLQYDIYHMQIMEGDLAPTIERNFKRIAHFQLADNPGRHEPGTGEINYPFLYGFIDGLGYDGWIGAEYKPRAKTGDGLGWVKQYL